VAPTTHDFGLRREVCTSGDFFGEGELGGRLTVHQRRSCFSPIATLLVVQIAECSGRL